MASVPLIVLQGERSSGSCSLLSQIIVRFCSAKVLLDTAGSVREFRGEFNLIFGVGHGKTVERFSSRHKSKTPQRLNAGFRL